MLNLTLPYNHVWRSRGRNLHVNLWTKCQLHALVTLSLGKWRRPGGPRTVPDSVNRQYLPPLFMQPIVLSLTDWDSLVSFQILTLYLKVVSYEVSWVGLPTAVYHIFWVTLEGLWCGSHAVHLQKDFTIYPPRWNTLATKTYQHLEDSEVKAQI